MHRSKKPSTQRIWSAWGDWVWSRTHTRYYSQRQDTYGEIETRWGPVENDVPRHRADRQEDLADALDGVHLADGEDGEYQDDPSYPHSQPTRGGNAADYSKSSGKRDDRKKKDKKGKGKSYVDERDEDYDADYADPDDGAGYAAQGQGSREPAREDRYSKRGKSTRQSSPPLAQTQYDTLAESYPGNDEIDAGYETAVRASRPSYNTGGASSSHVDPVYDDPESESGIAASTNDYLSGIENELDLDPRYRIEPSYKFQPGEVFKVLWPEPAGGASGKAPSLSDKKEVRDNYGGTIFVGFRRFIVVANDAGHCTCVPISTYGGKGCKKRGIKPEKHGIITEKGVRSKRLDGEPSLGFPSVRMKIQVDGERLARESRVNYSKIVTVEHNVKVFFIGTIYGGDYDLVVDAVNKCWEQKTFFKKH